PARYRSPRARYPVTDSLRGADSAGLCAPGDRLRLCRWHYDGTDGRLQTWLDRCALVPRQRCRAVVPGIGPLRPDHRHAWGLRLGLPPPTPDWGSMINETRSMAQVFPWMALFPCLAISSFVLGLNLLADGLQGLARRG